MLETKNLYKSYKTKKSESQVLTNINISINKGEAVAILGKSGSGKSTLMHLLAGLDKPTQGEIELNGQSLNKLKMKDLANIRNKNFGFIFQQFFLMPNNSVLDNVTLPLKIRGVSKGKRKELGLKALAEVDLSEKASSKANDLSGGQKQRVAIARAIVTEPEVIFADEPTGNLDSKTSAVIEKMLFDLNHEKGITLVVVTHDEDLASKCARQIFIKDGQIEKIIEN